jgi:hypothetical protein
MKESRFRLACAPEPTQQDGVTPSPGWFAITGFKGKSEFTREGFALALAFRAESGWAPIVNAWQWGNAIFFFRVMTATVAGQVSVKSLKP